MPVIVNTSKKVNKDVLNFKELKDGEIYTVVVSSNKEFIGSTGFRVGGDFIILKNNVKEECAVRPLYPISRTSLNNLQFQLVDSGYSITLTQE